MGKFPEPGECGCIRCSEAYDKAYIEKQEKFGNWMSEQDKIMFMLTESRSTRFIVCEICGNKRCPHATDHKFNCTNSNDRGQLGSDYQ